MGGESVADWMRNDVHQEEDAIAMYEGHIFEVFGDLLKEEGQG